ncbi:universal stress protein [Actinomadura graeca]|uniref:Universal stress protein n=1 Tax=Actinomadura graeca TaxID=2750812 RepID=A0ABX8QTL4_9ACTN|nr:universal stress protein [Actinomadura graeca]QXJ21529.1 universal stress protein [Actinomadura graeca]
MPDPDQAPSPPVPARTRDHLIAVAVADGRCGMAAAHRAARLAAASGGTVTMALLTRPPWAAAFEPSAMACWRNGDLEIAALIRLSAIFDPAGVGWRMAVVDGDPARGIVRLARRHPPDWVLVPRPRRPLPRAGGRRLAAVLRSRHGLPLLIV